MSVFDAKQFLGELGFSQTEVDELAPKFQGDRAEKLKGAVLRQQDYSRQMNEAQATLAAKQAEIAETEQRLAAEAAEWASLTAAEKAASQALRTQHEQTQRELLRHQQAFTRIAQEAGVDPKTYLGDPTPTPPPAPEPTTPALDTSKFASADAVAQLARLSLQIPAQITALAIEHRRLTGQDLDPTALVAELEKRASTRGNQKPLDLRTIWEEQHNIGQVRADAEAARIKKLEDDAFARGREAAMSEAALPPGAQPTGKHAIVFNPNRTSAVQRPQPGQGLQAAVTALATGKYRQPQSPA